jgi:predicted acylesterase/phospholipase RssA
MAVWEETLDDLRARQCLFLGGGGYKTLSFLGVLEILGWRHFTQVCGVSAGGILALLLCLKCSPSESLSLTGLSERGVQGGFSFSRLCSGQAPMDTAMLRSSLASILEGKGVKSDATLAELAEFATKTGAPAFSSVCLCLTTHKLMRYSASTHPHVSVIDLVLASTAIPMLFAPVALCPEALCCDAGLINSCPLSFFDPDDTLAMVVRWETPLQSVSFPQTINLRCHFTAQMSVERNRSRGMQILLVPFPQPGVSLLSRSTTPLSAFMDVGIYYIVLYVLRAEIAGALIVLLCSPCPRGQTQRHALLCRNPKWEEDCARDGQRGTPGA